MNLFSTAYRLFFGFLLGLLLMSTAELSAQVTVDNSTAFNGTNESESFTFSHTVGSGNARLLIVGISLRRRESNRQVTSVTYAGQTMTEISNQRGSKRRVQIFRLVNPDQGTNNVLVDINGTRDNRAGIGAVSFFNVDPANPTDTPVTVTGKAESSSIDVATEPDDLVMDVIGTDKDVVVPGTGQTLQYRAEPENDRASGGSTEDANSTATMSWDIQKDDGDPDESDFTHTGFNINAADLDNDLEINKNDSDDPVAPGDLFTYTIEILNNGSATTTGVTLTDNLPSEVTFRSVNTTQGSCAENNGTVDCNIGDMAGGQTEEINIIVEANTIGSATNNALVSGNEDDPNTANNSAAETTEINAQGTFRCYPIADAENRLDFIDTANNNVRQIGPLGVVDVEASAYNSATGVMYAANGNQLGTVNLNNGNFSARPNAFGTAGGSDGEIPLGDVDGLAYDPETGVMIGIQRRSGPEAAFLIDLDTGQHIPNAFGSGVDYVLINNPNNLETLDDIAVIGDFVYGVINNSSGQNDRLIRIDKNSFDPNNISVTDLGRIRNSSNNDGINDIEGLGISGEGRLVGVTGSSEAIFTIDQTSASGGSVFATKISDLPGNDYEAVDCISNSRTRSADLDVDKTVNNANPDEGDTITFTVTVQNQGPDQATSVQIADQLPSGLTFVSSTASQGNYDAGNGSWFVGTLNTGASATLDIEATVNSGTGGSTITNTASVEFVSQDDPNNGNDSDDADVNVERGYPAPNECFDLPYLQFLNPVLVAGSNGQLNAEYRFSNVTTGVDAIVTIVNRQNATLTTIDQNDQGGRDESFQPQLEATDKNQAEGFFDFQIEFVESGTRNVITLDEFAVTALDVDGDNNTTREFVGFRAGESYTIEGASNLIDSYQAPFNIFEAANSDVRQGIDSNDTENMVYLKYGANARFTIRAGLKDPTNTTGNAARRLFSFDFNSCLFNNFQNPQTTTIDADMAILKTVDEQNPAVGDTLQYTITATNNGPRTATGVAVRDSLPQEVTFVSSTASQGSYDAGTFRWDVGTLSNGDNATLTILAEVNDGTAGSAITNTASLLQLNQTDPNADNNSDTAQADVAGAISGVVFEDITGDALDDGDNTLNDAAGDQRAFANTKVLLFRDGGDGVPDGTDDTFVESTTTNANGEYSFSAGQDTYWVAVDSRTGDMTNGTTWAEQTYATTGAFCSDGNGGSTAKTSAGPCYGGRRGDQSDLLPASPAGSDLVNAEHLIEVTLDQPEAADNNFGFSYNVVTDVRDGDDDGAAARSIQGSLRQFIQNANTIAGANAMRFVPAVALNQGSWWQVAIASALPSITNAQTTIDGTAFDLANGVTVRNTNAGTTGNGGATVGVGADGIAGTGDEPALPGYELTELEINGNDAGRVFDIDANNTVVRRLAIYNAENSSAFTVSGGTGSEIRENLIGTRADGSDPGTNNRINQGVIAGDGAADILSNRVANIGGTGITTENTAIISGNDIFNTGITSVNSDGISVEGSNGQSIRVEENRIESIAAYGIESWQAPGPFTFENNTILNTGQGGGVEDGGIRIFGDGSTVRYNLVNGAAGSGIVVVQRTNAGESSTGNLISKNSIFGNGGISIDLDQTNTGGNPNGDGITPNNGATDPGLQNIDIDYPVFTKVTLSGNTLHVEGYVGTASSSITASHIIELFEADDDGNNNGEIEAGDGRNVPHGEGRTFLVDFTTNGDGTFNTDIALPNNALNIGDFITATTTNPGNNTSEFSANSEVEQPGVSVRGTVFSDANHNGTQDNSEGGIENVTVVLHNTADNTCVSVQTDADGAYLFDAVENGDYEIIEAAGESTPTPGSCPPAEADPAGFISTTSNTIDIAVTGAPVTEQNFGDFNGSRLTGTVFNDNGAGGGTANDGLQNGAESGIAQTTVRLTDASGNTVHAESQTGGEGSYTFFIPDGLSGSTLRVVETNFDNYVSTGGNAGNTGGSYDRTADATTFTPASGTEYSSVNFADVPDNSFSTDGQQNTTAGSTVFFPHTFTARTAGEVTFSEDHTANPANDGWKQIIYRDDNCNGEIDNGEQILSDTDAVTVTAGQQVCIVVRASTPGGAPEGSSNTITVTADFNYTNASPALSRSYNRTDLVNVTNASGSGLVISKEVDQAQALPGAMLTYTITYTNNSSQPINELEIVDSTPAYTGFTAASCQEPLPDNLTNCTITAPASGEEGSVIWTFEGTLAPGSGSTVTYQVTIQN